MSTATSRPAESPAPSSLFPTSPRWSGPQVVILCTIASTVLSLWFFAPRFWLWPVAGLSLQEMVSVQPEFHRAFYALQQLQDPWQRIADPINRVIEWRLFWPVVAHTLGLSPALYFAIAHAGCLVALATVAGITWRLTHHLLPCLTATLLTATSSWFFVSTGWLAYYDSWLIAALILATFGRARLTLFGAALIAPWIDERFILALPLVIAVRAIAADRDSGRDHRTLFRDALALAAGILPYVAVRFGAEISGARETSNAYWSNRPLLPAPWPAMVWGAWNGLRLGWVLLAVLGFAAVRGRRHSFWMIVCAVTLALNLVVADDVSRSASVAMPALVAAVLLAWRRENARSRRVLPLLALGNLALPAYHVIAAPGTSDPYHSVPILSAAAELERKNDPPLYAHPMTYTRRARDHFQHQLAARAMAAVEIALRLDPDSAEALASHGVLLHVAGKKAEGLAALDRALAITPELYDVRMQRAAFRQQAGDLRGALEDVRAALQHVPADWPWRQDAQQLERTLAAQVGR